MSDDYCFECTGYGDDYYMDENGEMQCACLICPLGPFAHLEDD